MRRACTIGACALLLVTTALGSAPAQAEGVRVLSTIKLPELTHRAQTIASVTVRRVEPELQTAADGQSLVVAHRLQVRVDRVIRGPAALRGELLWLRAPAREVPGRLRVIGRDYPGTFRPAEARVGDRLIAYVRRGISPGKARDVARQGLTLWHADGAAMADRVVRVVRQQRARRVARKARRTARASTGRRR